MRFHGKKLCYLVALSLLLGLLLSGSLLFSAKEASAHELEANGKVIVVSLSKQWLYAYQDGTEVYNAAVLTGRPALPTPTGTYHVFAKLSPTTFYSPFPPGSPYWYPPTYINYALEWKAGGYFLHDSWWHSVYGPGTNGWHYDPVDGWQWGSHGCVSMPVTAAAWLYSWAPIGTTVQINP
ncbi:MAG TPA: L,D-transpeptidase [Ktedonosporobacter sp.]|nr:L,D-transpeptidase [Ktedonosporobacter sp.]